MERDEGQKEAHCGAVGSLIDHKKKKEIQSSHTGFKKIAHFTHSILQIALKCELLPEKLSSCNLFPHI